jgi:hypothetical protein
MPVLSLSKDGEGAAQLYGAVSGAVVGVLILPAAQEKIELLPTHSFLGFEFAEKVGNNIILAVHIH